MATEPSGPQIICVTLNPAIDRTLEVRGLELGQHAKGRLLSRHPAGKAVNVARVLQCLGHPCILTGFIGEGERAMFERSFDSRIVRTQFFGVSGITRENITLVDPERSLELHVRDEGCEVSQDDQVRLTRKLKILAKPGVWMLFAGSLPRGLGPDRLRQMLQEVINKGAQVVLDSSEAAAHVIRRLPVWLIKPNRAELADLTGSPTDSPEALVHAAATLRGDAQVVLVSAGPDGCYLVEGPTVLHGRLRHLPKRVTNTVGCGDALLAGFLAARARAMDPGECVRHAVAAGTSACFQVRAGEIDSEEATRLAGEVEVEQLAG